MPKSVLMCHHWQPPESNWYSLSRASRLPLLAAARSRMLAWSQFLSTPLPRVKRSARDNSAETDPACTPSQSDATLSLAGGSALWMFGTLTRVRFLTRTVLPWVRTEGLFGPRSCQAACCSCADEVRSGFAVEASGFARSGTSLSGISDSLFGTVSASAFSEVPFI